VSAQSVDVLAVMDGARRTITAQSKLSDDVMAHIADDVAQARAAVAELIEAAQGVADNIVLRETSHGRAIRAALARVGGAS